MSPSFRLSGLDNRQFDALFCAPDEVLRARGAVRVKATADFGFPCRISLADARVDDELLLLSYDHQPEHSPYRASGPIYVRKGVRRVVLPRDVVPPYVTRRLISLRAYDADHMMIDAWVCDGSAVALHISEAFSNRDVSYVHLHNAKRGCFSCRADRADLENER